MKKNSLILLLALSASGIFAQNFPLQWQCRFAGLGDNSDKFNKIIAVPGGNYVAVGYTERNGNYKDFLTIKLDANLDTLWVRTKNGKNGGDDEAISAAVDASGNIFVTGYVDDGNTGDDIYTIKYDANGTDLWDTAYNNTTNAFLNDYPVDIKCDPSGNIIIAGYTQQGTWTLNNDDYIVLKYNSSGALLWRTTYDRVGFKDDASAMAVDASGNVFVTGRSNNGADDDYVTMKLDGTTGVQLWVPVRIYSGGYQDDRASAIALDNAGNPVVTGRSHNANGDDDFRTIKYSSAGTLQWSKGWAGSFGNDRATAIAIDQTTNDVYVTGESDGNGSTFTDYDIETVKYNSSGGPQWSVNWYGAAMNDDVPAAIVVDPSGNVILCGKTDADPDPTHSNQDWITIKYNSAGTKLYDKTVNGSRNNDDGATSLVVDAGGNAIVVGYIDNLNTRKEASRIQYDVSGNPTFTKYYNGEGDYSETARSMTQDASGNTYIAGYSFYDGNNRNIFCGKIDASGNLVDTCLLNGIKNDDDELSAITNDGNGNIYACGYTKVSGQKSNFITVKFDFHNYPFPDTAWTRTYNYTINQSDKAVSLAADGSGIYVTGYSDQDPNDTIANNDIVTIKYDAAGNQLWIQRFNGAANFRDEPIKLILGMNNRVYVTGRSQNAHDDDIILLAYDKTTGNTIAGYPAIWNSPFQDDDRPTDMVEGSNGTVYISGYSKSSSTIDDYAFVKCDVNGSISGTTFDGTAGQQDIANAIALDQSGNAIITGQMDVDFDPLVTNYDYATLIYDASGNYVCSAAMPFEYNGSANNDDVPIAVNVNGNEVYITGQSQEGNPLTPNKNIMVRAYSETSCTEFPEYAEYDGPAGGGESPNAVILASPSIFITGSSDGADGQKDAITLKYDLSTGMNSAAHSSIVSYVYPNPFNSTATISFNSDAFTIKNLSFKVYDVLGNEVFSKENVQSSVQLNKQSFADGIYTYKLFDSGKNISAGRFAVN